MVDYKKEAAFYIALMGWKLREDDGKQAIMWMWAIGAGCIFFFPRRLSRFPSARPPRPQQPAEAALPKVKSFAWVIDKWDAKTVAAELSKRGMTPVADNKGAFESFRVKDPDG